MYGKIIDNQIIFAPQTLLFEDGGCICNPNYEDFIQNGWKIYISGNIPVYDNNLNHLKISYIENETSLIEVYEVVNGRGGINDLY